VKKCRAISKDGLARTLLQWAAVQLQQTVCAGVRRVPTLVFATSPTFDQGVSVMKNATSAVLAMCLALAAGSVFAQDSTMAKDNMSQDSMSHTSKAHDGMKKDGMDHAMMKKDAMSKDKMANGTMTKDANSSDAMKNDTSHDSMANGSAQH
jgi:pentapeptide MXKDX repeat protein